MCFYWIKNKMFLFLYLEWNLYGIHQFVLMLDIQWRWQSRLCDDYFVFFIMYSVCVCATLTNEILNKLMCLIRPIDDLFQHFIHIFSYVWSDRIFSPFKLDYNWRGFLFLFGIMLLLPCFLFCMCNKSLGCAGFFFLFS